MAFPAYLSVKGSRQGQFKGESIQPKRKDEWIPGPAVGQGWQSPHDAATGQASGKRRFERVRIVKEWGAASPQGLTACATNEVLTDVAIEFTKTNPNGEEYVYQSVHLTNATIARVDRFKGRLRPADNVPSSDPQTNHNGSVDPLELEEWAFIFQKIQLVDNDGQTKFADDWLVAP
jgi:type VI secretion system secreted protein Hcp